MGNASVPGKFEVLRNGRGTVARLVKSDWVVRVLEPVADRVLAAVKSDPNPLYSRYAYKRVDRRRKDRVRWIVTLPPSLDPLARRVEAKRSTMARAADRAG